MCVCVCNSTIHHTHKIFLLSHTLPVVLNCMYVCVCVCVCVHVCVYVCMYDSIEDDVDLTSVNVELGHGQLLKHLNSITNNRGLILKIFMFLIMFAIFFVVFVM